MSISQAVLPPSSRDSGPFPYVRVSAAFGLVCGLVEGAGYLTLQHFDLLNWKAANAFVDRRILFISPIVDFALFVLAGLALLIVSRPLGQRGPRFAVGALSFLVFLDWLALSSELRFLGAFSLALGLAACSLRWARGRETVVAATSRHLLPFLAGLALLLCIGIEAARALAERAASAVGPPSDSAAPNVLLVILDTVRADHTSAYGYSRATTPNLERICRQGVLFEQAFSNSGWTLPAHASLLTGYEPQKHGAEILSYDGRFPSLAQEFLQRGYRTGAFSANYVFFSRRAGFGQGFQLFQDIFGSVTDMFIRTFYGRMVNERFAPRLGYKDILGRKRASEVNEEFLNWLDRRPSHPFFAVLNYYDAHDPYRPPQPFRSRFSQFPDPGGALSEFGDRLQLEDKHLLQSEIDAYDGGIAYMDDQVGRLFQALESRGLLQNTCVILTSDHGEFLGEHDLYLHYNRLYRESIEIPLIFFWKGHIPEGTRVAQPLVSLKEIPATLMDLIPTGQSIRFPGHSLVPLWNGRGTPEGFEHPLSRMVRVNWSKEIWRGPRHAGTLLQFSLITPDWHYLYSEGQQDELYDRSHDPGEMHNLALTPQGQAEVRLLREEARERGAFSNP